MRIIFSLLLALLTVSAQLHAEITYDTLTLEDLSIEIRVPTPENLAGYEMDGVDLFYLDESNLLRTLALTCHVLPNFNIHSLGQSGFKIQFAESGTYATRSFTTTEPSDNDLYLHVHVGTLDSDIVFIVAASSPESEEDAIQICDRFISGMSSTTKSCSDSLSLPAEDQEEGVW